MKTKYILKGLIATLLLLFIVSGCENYSEGVIEDIGASRELSPIGITARIRNQTKVELDWTVSEDADHYTVEIAAGDPEFKTIFKTINVNAAELPIQVALEGETVYSIRVKSVSNTGKSDSKWSVVTATTLSEQLFLAVQDGDILSKDVTLRWVPNSNVTELVLKNSDPLKTVTHTITAEEKVSGIATITGLTSQTIYTADLYNNTSRRGSRVIKTGIDISDGIEVGPEDNLATVVANAPTGSVLILKPGDYTSQVITLILTKPVTIRGLRDFDKPKLKLTFSITPNSGDVSLIDLDLKGDAGNKVDVIRYSASADYGKLLISGCTINDYDRTFIGAGSGIAAKIESIIVENSVITNVGTAGTGSFIDFRAAFADEIILRQSTFNKCVAGGSAFIREDSATTFGTVTSDISIENCTLYGVTNTIAASGSQIFYVRFVKHNLAVRNSIFAETVARYANQSTTDSPVFVKNNYYNTPNLNFANPVLPLKSDVSGTALDPQFVNAISGDFTVQNQNLIDNNIGDQRWIK
ncbi:DUF5123 domain-containing protein [Flavobacterium sp.]|uniref:DUF5123 domain-containing protein n=1 Tax=Flavobacterium sp. TaxID=239 RepID=UPI00326560B8